MQGLLVGSLTIVILGVQGRIKIALITFGTWLVTSLGTWTTMLAKVGTMRKDFFDVYDINAIY
jgi:hypothetical protein